MSDEYIHGTEPEEQRRLSDLNGLLNQVSLGALAPRRGERMLEVGAGLGHFSRVVARRTGIAVVAVERSLEQLSRARDLAAADAEQGLIDLRGGDARSLPLVGAEWGSFDVAHARFLLEHVDDPQAVVDQMARAVRPGGRVVLEDDDHAALRLWPEPPGVMAVWQAYLRSYDRLGCDPFVGRRLIALMAAAGLEPRRIELLPFGACSGQPQFAAVVANLVDILLGARAAIVATAGVDDATIDCAVDGLRSFAGRRDAAFWYSVSWAEATRPEAP
jgi:SAM-dependent methyltransferase